VVALARKRFIVYLDSESRGLLCQMRVER